MFFCKILFSSLVSTFESIFCYNVYYHHIAQSIKGIFIKHVRMYHRHMAHNLFITIRSTCTFAYTQVVHSYLFDTSTAYQLLGLVVQFSFLRVACIFLSFSLLIFAIAYTYESIESIFSLEYMLPLFFQKYEGIMIECISESFIGRWHRMYICWPTSAYV